MSRRNNRFRGDGSRVRQASRVLGALAMLLAWALPSDAQQKTADLTNLSLEDLMNLQVTSVSKKDQKISQAAAAAKRTRIVSSSQKQQIELCYSC